MTKLVAIATLLALAGLASGDRKRDAKPHIDAATKAHAAGDFDTALVELQAAYAIDPRPDFLYAIGQVQSKLGNCTDATAYFERFRATQKDPAVAKVIDQAIAACKPRVVAAPEPPPPVERPAPVAPPPPPPPSPWYAVTVADAIVGTGVAATVVGLLFYRSASADLDAAEGSANLAAYRDLVHEAHNRRATAVIMMSGGGILLITGIAKYLHPTRRETHAVGIVPASGGGLVTFGGRF